MKGKDDMSILAVGPKRTWEEIGQQAQELKRLLAEMNIPILVDPSMSEDRCVMVSYEVDDNGELIVRDSVVLENVGKP